MKDVEGPDAMLAGGEAPPPARLPGLREFHPAGAHGVPSPPVDPTWARQLEAERAYARWIRELEIKAGRIAPHPVPEGVTPLGRWVDALPCLTLKRRDDEPRRAAPSWLTPRVRDAWADEQRLYRRQELAELGVTKADAQGARSKRRWAA